MKKWLGILMLAFISVGLVGCKSSNYKHDGTFTAFEVSENYGAPQITWVSVNIKDGAIKSYNIDERQTKDGVWNEKTKKELGFEYGMKDAPKNKIGKEWFEQAESIELYFLKHGPDKLKLTEDGKVDGLVGATMVADHYKRVALKALENAKNGIYSAFEVGYNYGAVQLSWADVHYNKKGEVIKYNIDELQSKDGAWNFKTKKELGFDYGMTVASPIKKEWFEQAEAIENFFLANTPEDISLDQDGYVDNITNATMIASSYRRLAIAARDMKDVLDAPNGKLIGVEEEPVGVEFPYDGKFVAFEAPAGKLEVTWVEVIVFNGKVYSYYIDVRQSKDGKFNEKTKKELGYDYRMFNGAKDMTHEDYLKHLRDNNKQEWFEQAYEIENFFLKNGPSALDLNGGKVDNIAGVSITGETYKKLALEALDKARNGVYTAFETDTNSVTSVDITYDSKGEIKSYYIDTLQSKDGKFNEKTKKELGYDYRMFNGAKDMTHEDYLKHLRDNNKQEWFEQAKLIEDFFLENSPEELILKDDDKVDNVAGATIKAATYKKVAMEAYGLNGDFFTGNLKNNGTFKGFEISNDSGQITWVDLVVEDGVIKSYYIDTLQSKVAENVLTWNEKTKKELGYAYRMHGQRELSEAEYKKWLKDNNKLEWFEQAKLIEDFFLANNPWTLMTDENGYVDGVAGATIKANTYQDVAIKALINAYYGVHTEFEAGLNKGAPQVTWVNGFARDGEIYAYFIDTLQSSIKDNKVVWNDKTKKELGFDYRMTGASPIGKEWFEQANVIEKEFVISGPENLPLKDDGKVDGITGATMNAVTYKKLAIEVSK